ncbi:MAG: extracellular solute-binding protein [Ruminococcaceae bacterium]|nr:extracellular solute-binding protein [Oscillospiraceae bacterium]
MKKLLSLVIALLMLFSLVACNGGGANDDATPTPSADATPTQAQTVDYTEGGKYMNDPGANGNPEWRLLNYPVTSDTVTFMIHYEEGQPAVDKENAFRDIYNMKWQTNVVAAADRITKLVSSVMGGESPDIFRYDTFQPTLANKGYIVAWDDYIDLSTGLWTDLKTGLDATLFKGKHYGLSTKMNTDAGDGMWINLEIFDELGVKSPVEYYNEGNWTYDTLLECARAVQTDSDSDGIPEIWGVSIELTEAFLYPSGKDIVSMNPDGTVTNNIRSPEIASAVNFTVDLFNAGVEYDGSDGRTAFAQGKIAMMVGCYWYYQGGTYKDMFARDAIAWVPFPRDPASENYYACMYFGENMLCANAPNPYGAAALMDAARYDVLDDHDKEEVDAEAFFEEKGIPYEMEMYVQEQKLRDGLTPVLMTWTTFEMGQFWGDIWFRPLLGEPWSAVAEEIAPRIDDVIAGIMEE